MFSSFLLFLCWCKWHFLLILIMYSNCNKEPLKNKSDNNIKYWEKMPKEMISNYNFIKMHIDKLWSIPHCKWRFPNKSTNQRKSKIAEIVEGEGVYQGSATCSGMTTFQHKNKKYHKNQHLKFKMRKIS